jgi:DNA-binding NarL/FixJ family response regulator
VTTEDMAAGGPAVRGPGDVRDGRRPRGSPLRIVLCDDHTVVRDGLRLVLSGEPDMEVVGEASGGADLFDVVQVCRPDVLILDLTLDDHDGIPLLRDMRARYPAVAVVILTMHRDPETVRQSLLAGAAGYVVKGARSSDLADAIRAVARDERYVHSSVVGTVVDDSVNWLRSGTGLSQREREILSLIAGGQTAPMVAERLGISVHTVHRHIANLSAKLNAHGLPALVRFAIEHGFVRTPGVPAPRTPDPGDTNAKPDSGVAPERGT